MYNVLMIDDDVDLTVLVKMALEQKGYQVDVFSDAARAVHFATENLPDVILMDLMMPGMTGSEAVKFLRSRSILENVPIIFVTGLVSRDDKDIESSGLNIDGEIYSVLGKPFEIDVLCKLIQNVLRRK